MKRLHSLLLVLLSAVASAHAGTQIGLQVDRYRWREFDGGDKLLEEEGAIPGLFLRHDAELAKSIGLHAAVFAYSGTVHYDGALITEDGLIPFESRTRYTGVRADVDASYSLGSGALRVRPFVGIGARYWLRELGRLMAYGYDEYWLLPYGRAGARLERPGGEKGFGWFASAAALFPFAVDETVKGVEEAEGDIKVEPKEKVGYEAEVGIVSGRLAVSAYWQAQDFGQSDLDASGQFLQPKSKLMIFGLRAGVSF